MVSRSRQKQRRTKKTIFIVHHDLNNIEKYFDWLVLLNVRLIASAPTSKAFCEEKSVR